MWIKVVDEKEIGNISDKKCAPSKKSEWMLVFASLQVAMAFLKLMMVACLYKDAGTHLLLFRSDMAD